MRNLSVALIVLGLMLLVWAFQIDTTVYSSGTYIGGEIVGGGSTYNLGLLQRQMMFFQTALAMVISGVVLFGFSPRPEGKEAREPTVLHLTDEELEEWEADRAAEHKKRIIGASITVAIVALVLFVLARNGA